MPPQLTPLQRGPATCPHSDALRLADGKALTRSARHRWPQKAWKLEWHFSQGSSGLSTPAAICPGSSLEKSRENLAGGSHQVLTFGPGRPGWPGFPLKPWKKKQELPHQLKQRPQAEVASHSSLPGSNKSNPSKVITQSPRDVDGSCPAHQGTCPGLEPPSSQPLPTAQLTGGPMSPGGPAGPGSP